jgi:hypothetical protein
MMKAEKMKIMEIILRKGDTGTSKDLAMQPIVVFATLTVRDAIVTTKMRAQLSEMLQAMVRLSSAWKLRFGKTTMAESLLLISDAVVNFWT